MPPRSRTSGTLRHHSCPTPAAPRAGQRARPACRARERPRRSPGARPTRVRRPGMSGPHAARRPATDRGSAVGPGHRALLSPQPTLDSVCEPALQAVDLAHVGLAPFDLRARLELALLGHEPPDPAHQVGDFIVRATSLGREDHASIRIPLLHRSRLSSRGGPISSESSRVGLPSPQVSAYGLPQASFLGLGTRTGEFSDET
jgi:hypothetical protein